MRDDRWQVVEIKARVVLSELLARDVALVRKGTKLWACCPFHNERSPSFNIDDKRGFYKCFGCGATGDHFAWLREHHGMDFRTAKVELMRLANIEPAEWERADPAALIKAQAERAAQLHQREQRWRDKKGRLAHEIWKASLPIKGTPAEAYLMHRGVDLAALNYPPTLRYNPSLVHSYTDTSHPCMVGYVQGPDGSFAGVHRTFLLPDGSDKIRIINPEDGRPYPAKLMLGDVWAGSVRFAKAAKLLAIGEGIETCLSVLQASPSLATWAALSLNNIAGAGIGTGEPHPDKPGKSLPSTVFDPERPGIGLQAEVRTVLLLADNDNKDPAAADCILQRAANRWRAEGRRVLIATPPVGMDFNDWWLEQRKLLAGAGIA